jgi:hypothetical protein
MESALRERRRGREVERFKVLITRRIDIHNYYV